MYLLDSNILIDISRRKLRYAYDALMLSDATLQSSCNREGRASSRRREEQPTEEEA